MCPQRSTTHEPRAVILSVLTLKKVNPTYYTVHVCSLYTEVVAVVGSRSAARRELRQLLLGDRARDALDGAADVLDLRPLKLLPLFIKSIDDAVLSLHFFPH